MSYGPPTVPSVPELTKGRMYGWIGAGYLRPVRERPADEPGPGNRWYWPDEEVRVAQNMVRLVDAGLVPSVAARVAREPTLLVNRLVRLLTGGAGAR